MDKKHPVEKILRDDTAKQYRKIHKILIRGRSDPEAMNDQEESIWDFAPWLIGWALLVLVTCFAMTCTPTPAHAYTDKEAIKAIVGEAANQGKAGMIAVAEVIRHRKSLKGIYGFNAKHVSGEPRWVWLQAKRAWKLSGGSNHTNGATFFENLKFGVPYWRRGCVVTAVIGDHTFFRGR